LNEKAPSEEFNPNEVLIETEVEKPLTVTQVEEVKA